MCIPRKNKPYIDFHCPQDKCDEEFKLHYDNDKCEEKVPVTEINDTGDLL